MEFALSEDQIMLQQSVSGVLARVSPLDEVRDVADGKTSADAISGALAELGTNLLHVPEAQGGLDMGVLEAALVQIAIGGSVSPARFMSNTIAAAALRRSDDTQSQTWLSKLASDEVSFGIGLTEHVSARDGAGIDAKDGKLSGTAMFVLDADTASHLLLCDKAGGLHITATKNLKVEPLNTIDRTRSFSKVTLTSASSEKLNAPDDTIDQVIRIARLLVAADSLGAAQIMLEKAVEYAKERKQFNRIIGSFQAVKHMCAEMAAEIEPCVALVWHAAYALDTNDPEGALMANLAKSHVSEVATFAARTSTEVFGGMGFTDLVGLHYWFKRIGVNRQLFGSPEQVRDDAARLQGWIS